MQVGLLPLYWVPQFLYSMVNLILTGRGYYNDDFCVVMVLQISGLICSMISCPYILLFNFDLRVHINLLVLNNSVTRSDFMRILHI